MRGALKFNLIKLIREKSKAETLIKYSISVCHHSTNEGIYSTNEGIYSTNEKNEKAVIVFIYQRFQLILFKNILEYFHSINEGII